MTRSLKLGLGAGALALLLALAFVATRVSSNGQVRPRALTSVDNAQSAPEFTGIAHWINSEPRTLRSLRGKVVWIDFWTYSCVNCVRTFPFLRQLYARYHPVGLEIIGVHSPEFDFEKSEPNVRAAVKKYRLPYPVAMDNDMATWRAYGNAYWPRVYLIDAEGKIRFDHAGEGAEDELQNNLRALLTAAGAATLPAPLDLNDLSPTANITPEIYAGFERGGQQGNLANNEGYHPDADVRYASVRVADVRAAGTNGAFFLEGTWHNGAEYVEATKDGARVLLPFFARNAFVVADGHPGVTASVSLDGARATTVGVDHADLYPLAKLEQPGTGVVAVTVSKGFRLYTFTFG